MLFHGIIGVTEEVVLLISRSPSAWVLIWVTKGNTDGISGMGILIVVLFNNELDVAVIEINLSVNIYLN